MFNKIYISIFLLIVIFQIQTINVFAYENFKWVIEPKYDFSGDFSEGLASFMVNNKWGYIDMTGTVVIPAQYNYTTKFSDGLAKVRDGSRWGYIDKTGTVVIPCEYDYAGNFSNGLSAISTYKSFYIDKKGNVAIPFSYEVNGDFSEGLAAVSSGGKWGYIDVSGNFIIPPIYLSASKFSDGLAKVVTSDSKNIFIDKTGKVIIRYEYDDYLYVSDNFSFSEGLLCVFKDNKYGFIDKTGKIVIPFEYDNAKMFSNGLAAVEKNSKWGFINKTGKVVIPLEYTKAASFSMGLARVSKNTKFGFITYIDSSREIFKAIPTKSKISINDKILDFSSYQINGDDYFKLRDIAVAFNNTDKQFDIIYNDNKKTIDLFFGKPYSIKNHQLDFYDAKEKTATIGNEHIHKDDTDISYLCYKIDGNNFLNINDISKVLGVDFIVDKQKNIINIYTFK